MARLFDRENSERREPGPLAPTSARPAISLAEAAEETASVVDILVDLAYRREDSVQQIVATGQAGVHVNKGWCKPARTYTYHMHAFAPAGQRTLVIPLADVFYNAALLDEHPWHDGFVSGTTAPVAARPVDHRVASHQLTATRFNFGLGVRRTYVQLCSLVALGADRRAIVLRSVNQAPPNTRDYALAYSLAPTGDVISWRDGALHWHHIVTAAGVGIFPPFFERRMMNLMRRLGFNQSEISIYREEGRQWVYFVSDTDRVMNTQRKLFSKSRAR